MTDDADDPFKPLSAKGQKQKYTISGRVINSPAKAQAAADRSLRQSIRNKIKHQKKPASGENST